MIYLSFKDQHSHNSRGASLKYTKNETFHSSKSVQVKAVNDWNNIVDKILLYT